MSTSEFSPETSPPMTCPTMEMASDGDPTVLPAGYAGSTSRTTWKL
jgi:hypothetical protein